MRYSLLSRELIAGMVEAQTRANAFDGMALISSCDKAVPAHLMAIMRLNIPSVFVPGGVMPAGADGFTLEQMGDADAALKTGKMTGDAFHGCQRNACPSCGACQFMGTAATMQVMAEALGLALPHSALVPAHLKFAGLAAKRAGKALTKLVAQGIRPRDIVTEKALHNAIVVHGAIGGSTNALLHLPAIAREAGLSFHAADVDTLHREIPFMVNTRPSGQYGTDMLWYAGGVPALMRQLRAHLHLDVLTVTGKTLGENLDEYDETAFEGWLSNYNVAKTDVIRRISDAGAIAILSGNLAPGGAVVKYTGLPAGMRHFQGKARVFENETDAREAILYGGIQPGDCIVLRYAGPKGAGMPEMFYTTQALCANPVLSASTAIITDGRFSGASTGPCVGHISPEAAEGGNIALVHEGDVIEIDIENRTINVLGVDFEARRAEWAYRPPTARGILGLYQKTAASAMLGGYMA